MPDALPRSAGAARWTAFPRFSTPLTALAFAGLLAATPPVHAQIGGPIGAPTGVPNGLPSGASGYSSNSGGSLAPPVNNWSANDAGRGAFGGRYGSGFGSSSRSRDSSREEVPLPPAMRGRQDAPSAAGQARDPRGRNDETPWSRDDATASSGPSDRRAGSRTPPTRKLAAAEHNSIDALRDLVQKGQMYESGLGMPKNLSRAFDLYCEAARDGYPDALLRMGWMFAEGNGVEKNLDAASTLFKRAARFGSGAGDELAKRFRGDGRELLPVCLKGTLVEKGTAERPATAAELSAMAPRFDSPLMMRNTVLSGERSRFVNMVLAEAKAFKLDPRLVLAVMATESGFDPNAKSTRNALGLMQLIPETAERFNVKDILDPMQNIRGGMAYLRWLLSYYRGDVTLALAAYNAGEGAVDKYNGVPPYTETVAYVQRIRAIYPFDRHPYDATVSNGYSRATVPQDDKARAVAANEKPLARN
jgi:hypothetical protein